MITADNGISIGLILTLLSAVIGLSVYIRNLKKDKKSEEKESLTELTQKIKDELDKERRIKDVEDSLRKGNDRFKELDLFMKEMREYTRSNNELVQTMQKKLESNDKERAKVVELELVKFRALEKALEKHNDDPEVVEILDNLKKKYDEVMVKKNEV